MREFDQKRAEALAWTYFKLILPKSREVFKAKYKEASDRLKPGRHPGNTKGEYMEMRDFYHDLLAANPEWAFTNEPSAWRPKRPNRGMSRRPIKVFAAGAGESDHEESTLR
jgi:hypothetical protein